MSAIAIVAALDRELAPLVRTWRPTQISEQGRRFRLFEQDNIVAVAGGIGRHAAAIAAVAVVRRFRPQVLISAGFAGALGTSLRVGSVIAPDTVVDAANGTEYHIGTGNGILVTAAEIAGAASKQVLANRFHALAVDMEAAAVAQVAQQEQISFRCVKAISDEAAFVMPPLNRFVDQQGRFQSGRFASWVAVRPHYWLRTIALARNSKCAARTLCKWLEEHVCEGFQGETVDKFMPSCGGDPATREGVHRARPEPVEERNPEAQRANPLGHDAKR